MAVTAHLYPIGIQKLVQGSLDLDTHVLKVALLNNTPTFDLAHDEFADVSANEVAASGGYIAGGKALTTPAVSIISGNTVKLDFDDVTWGSSTITAYKAVIYDDTASGDPLIAFIDFGGAQTSTAGTFTLTFDANGLLNIQAA